MYNKDLVLNNSVNKTVFYLYLKNFDVDNLCFEGLSLNPNIT